ncbi:MAG: alpha/beta fold hydrolase [Candidatus Pseudobacter hemicellulosilyticus]|uniref:Alpha/beta fold hydrolase n=1 Tax=Candidatus Pseudobacter hemicellulosilyticus TaxID=3121375 RepID=A0AAJ5WYU5_9BACT|nr:MAG: alpha/beta fold hydrolase [Pseudobacter sp.]
MQQLLLLHGAIGAKDQLAPLASALSTDFTIHTLNFSGHGGRPFGEKPFSMALFGEDVRAYIREQGLGSVAIFGYSMGGYVGMYLARHYPGLVSRLVTLGTKFEWTEAIAARQQRLFDAAAIREKAPGMATQLQQLHAPQDWVQVLQQTAGMLTAMGQLNPISATDYPLIQTPALLMQGDRDKMVPLEETIAVYKSLPAAECCILPATPHPLEQADISLIAGLIRGFLCKASPVG